jgi:hypothetical protein
MYQFGTCFLDRSFHLLLDIGSFVDASHFDWTKYGPPTNQHSLHYQSLLLRRVHTWAFVQYYTTNLSRTMSTSWQVTPITSRGIMDPTIPGKCDTSQATATFISPVCGVPKHRPTAACIVGKSLGEPITTPTSGDLCCYSWLCGFAAFGIYTIQNNAGIDPF